MDRNELRRRRRRSSRLLSASIQNFADAIENECVRSRVARCRCRVRVPHDFADERKRQPLAREMTAECMAQIVEANATRDGGDTLRDRKIPTECRVAIWPAAPGHEG